MTSEPSRSAWDELAHARTCHVLAEAGVDYVVIKGPTISRWLYRPGERTTGDVDVLVNPSDFSTALDALGRAGFAAVDSGLAGSEVAPHSVTLADAVLGYEVDVHHSFPGIGRDAQEAWRSLTQEPEPVDLAGVIARQLGLPGRALLVVLHAAREGRVGWKALEDLRRCVTAVTRAEWERIAALAEELHAVPAFSAGLSLDSVGEQLRTALGIGDAADLEWVLRSRTRLGPAFSLYEISEASRSQRVRLVLRKLWPTAASLRKNSPIARRGWWGVALVRLAQPARVAVKLPGAIRELRAARRSTRGRPDAGQE